MELWCNVRWISPCRTQESARLTDQYWLLHVVGQSTARSKVDQHTSSDLDLISRFIANSPSLDHDVVGLEVSMSQSMTIKVSESRSYLRDDGRHHSMRNDRWCFEPLSQQSSKTHLDELQHEELSLSVALSAVSILSDGSLASELGKMRSNVVVDLVDELAQEPNNVWMRRKLHELDELVDVCVASLIGVELKVEAHFESVLLVKPQEAWRRARDESNHAVISKSEHLRHLELVGSPTSGRHESLLKDLVSCSLQ